MNFLLPLRRLKVIYKGSQLLITKHGKYKPSIIKSINRFSTSAYHSKLFISSPGPFTLIKTTETSPNTIGLEFQDSVKCELNYMWLRDNCHCERCVDHGSKQKIVDTLDLDPNVKPKSIILKKNGLEIEWGGTSEETHTSFYDSMWLHKFCVGFQSESQLALLDALPPVHVWDRNEIASSHIQVSYREVMDTEKGLMKLLEQLYFFGLVVIRDAPLKRNEVENVIQRFTTARKINSVSTFEVSTKPTTPDNMDDVGRYLDFHTDMDYLERLPAIQALHCLETTSSDESTHGGIQPGQYYFVDGFLAAKWLEEYHPENFLLLVSVPVKFRNIIHDKEFMSNQYILNLAARKGISEIHFNNRFMSPIEGPAFLLESFYDSYRLFGQKLRDPALRVPVVLRPGYMVVFNNKRVLHTRSTFDKTMPSEIIEGCFGEMDDVVARLRFAWNGKIGV